MHKKLFCLKPLHDPTKGKDIFNTFNKLFQKSEINIKKIFFFTADGAPTMMGQHREFVAFVEQKIGHSGVKLHCIIYQENLCIKVFNSALNDVMLTKTKIMNFLAARSATTQRQFYFCLKRWKLHTMMCPCTAKSNS